MNKNITKGNEFQKGGVWPNLMLIIERKLKKKNSLENFFIRVRQQSASVVVYKSTFSQKNPVY